MKPAHQTLHELKLNVRRRAVRAAGDRLGRDALHHGAAMIQPSALTYDQLQQVKTAAKTLLPSQRSDFVHNVKRRLGEQPSDAAVQAAIAAELALNRLPVFLCDSAFKETSK